MISIDVITCLPEILDGPLNGSIVKRAQEKKLIEINIHNLRDYSTCLLYTSPSPRDSVGSRMPSSA